MLFKVLLLLLWCFTIFANCDETGGPKLRIIGGQETKNNYKFMISLQVYGRETNILGMATGRSKYHHICGGSIVGKDCIVTAAHCVQNFTPSALSVLAGTNNLDDEFGDRYYLRNVSIHYKYSSLVESDIAVIRLNETLKYSNRVGPIEQSKEYVGGNVKLLLLGWGHTNPTKFGTLPPRRLRALNTTTITNEECNKNPVVKASNTDLCTYERMGQGACNGDSGGPLILCRDGNVTLVAIVSRGFLVCSMYRIPDVFTRASLFMDWINEQCENEELVHDADT